MAKFTTVHTQKSSENRSGWPVTTGIAVVVLAVVITAVSVITAVVTVVVFIFAMVLAVVVVAVAVAMIVLDCGYGSACRCCWSRNSFKTKPIFPSPRAVATQ